MEISHDEQYSNKVQPRNDHMLPLESIITHKSNYSDDDEYTASAGDESKKYTLEDGDSTSGDDEIEYYHSANLSSYFLKYAWNIDINDVYEEDCEILECENDIYGDKIDDLHSICVVKKDIKDI